MADPSDRIRNLGLSQDVRTFVLVANIPLPVEGQVLTLMPDAPFPFEVINVKRNNGGESDDSLDLRFEIDNLIMDFTDTDSAGVLPCLDGVLVTSEPDGSHDTVPEGGTLECYMINLSAGVQDVIVQVTCRRTEVNVAV